MGFTIRKLANPLRNVDQVSRPFLTLCPCGKKADKSPVSPGGLTQHRPNADYRNAEGKALPRKARKAMWCDRAAILKAKAQALADAEAADKAKTDAARAWAIQKGEAPDAPAVT